MIKRFLFLMLIWSVRFAYSAAIAISPAASTVHINDVFTLSVSAQSVTDLYAWQFDLAFDPVALEVIQIDEGPFLATGGVTLFLPGSIDNIGGVASASASTLLGPVPGVSGNGVLAVFTFRALSAGLTALSPFNESLLDSNLFTLVAPPSSGSVNVLSPEPGALVLFSAGALVLAFAGARRRLRGPSAAAGKRSLRC